MHRLWPCLAAVLVSSCIQVADFGTYWDRGVIDPALDGTWRKVEGMVHDGDPGPLPAAWTFRKSGANYAVRAMSPGAQGRVDSRQFTARSLRVGPALFLMLRDPEGRSPGLIERYEVDGATLRAYRLDKNAAAIDVFDDGAFRMLAKAADDPMAWRSHGEYRKLTAAGDGGNATAQPQPGPLAAPPGSSLPPPDRPQQQVVTLFDITQQRDVDTRFFVAGVGYVSINGGGSVLAGMNRALDPFIELTIANGRDPVLTSCRALLTPASLATHAIRIGGMGRFTRLPGVNDRQLVVVHLDTLSDCTLVPRR